MITAYELIRPYQIMIIASGVINLILDFTLVPRIGISGAAVATLCAFMINAMASRTLANRVYNTSTPRQMAPITTVIAVAITSLLFKGPLFYPLSLIVLFTCIIILLKKTRLFEPGDEEFLNRVNMPGGVRRAAFAVYKALTRLS
jgi:O-antigen/teichoic acid export membrane protein